MHAPQDRMKGSTHIGRRSGYRTRALYWATQLSGWGFYLGFVWLWTQFDDEPNDDIITMLFVHFIAGVTCSHLFRSFIIRNHWLERHIGFVLPRLTLGAMAVGTLAFLMEAIFHDTMLVEYEPLFSREFLFLFARILNWVTLMFIWSLAYFAYNYFQRHRREEIRNLRLEAADRENQLNNLRAQMNPHFMFNAMNSIRALIDEDPEHAKRSITLLSAILRNAMATMKRQVVPLGEEIDIVKAYLGLEAIRYEERLRVQFHVAPEVDRVLVPPMLLQTLVENAVRHGVARLPQGGEVIISADLRGDHLCLQVRNSGSYEQGKINGTGIGLQNTRKRLEMLYGPKASLNIANEEGSVVTEVIIPLTPDRTRTPKERTIER